MDKKYFFFDIDGTLTDTKTHQIVPSALKTLHDLMENGHFVAIATGRMHYKAIAFTNQIGIFNVVCSGGQCLVLDGKMLYHHPLPKPKVKQLIELAKQYQIGYLLAPYDQDIVVMQDYQFLIQAGLRKELTTYIYQPDHTVDDYEQIYKLYLAITDEHLRQYPWLNMLGHLKMTPTYHVYQHDDKKAGILDMLKHVNGQAKDVVVFGDDYNDLVMFDSQFYKVAMGNGVEALKQKADFVTKANVEDGIRYACQVHGWI